MILRLKISTWTCQRQLTLPGVSWSSRVTKYAGMRCPHHSWREMHQSLWQTHSE